jgi:site-specific DNA-cytosine methylase
MMNMWPTKTKRDPISDSVTPRKARILVMQGWNRWQILVMLRSFDPIPGKPVVVFDLFSGIGTGFLAAIDTPKITSAPRVTWISIEKDRDASWLHYNSARATVTQDAFDGDIEFVSYVDIETGWIRSDLAIASDKTRDLIARMGHEGAWWIDPTKVSDLLHTLGVPRRNVLVLNGSPCDDCSGNNPRRKGKDGVRSQLFRFGPMVYSAIQDKQ